MADKDRSDIEGTETGVELGLKAETENQESGEERARLEARRRILKGGIASAPLILTLASRPAMAGGGHHGGHYGGKCQISGKLSGNTSHAHDDKTRYCRGKEPRYWKVNYDGCQKHFDTGPCNPIYQDYYTCNDYSVPTKYELTKYRDKLKQYSWNSDKIWYVDQYLGWLDQCPEADETPPFGTPFAEIFGSGIAQDYKLTLMQALWLDDNSPYPPSGLEAPSSLLSNIAAAYCNACEYRKDYYGLSRREVVEKVQREIFSNPLKLEEDLKMLNSQG